MSLCDKIHLINMVCICTMYQSLNNGIRNCVLPNLKINSSEQEYQMSCYIYYTCGAIFLKLPKVYYVPATLLYTVHL